MTTPNITVERGFQGATARSQRNCRGNGRTVVYRVMINGEEFAQFKKKGDALPVAEFAKTWTGALTGIGDLETAYYKNQEAK